jgi:adenylate kinase family enzyme
MRVTAGPGGRAGEKLLYGAVVLRYRQQVRVSTLDFAMNTHRILIFGNSGSGKTTLARRLAAEHGLPHLDLDSLAWGDTAVRREPSESEREIHGFLATHPQWVVEGCYGDLLEVVLPHASELRFLNPGVEACVANCRARPWEPEKYASPEEQDERLEFLIGWVRDYEHRSDEYSLARHSRIFDAFAGPKQEITGASQHPADR